MANAVWTQVATKSGVRTFQATINLTDTQTAILKLDQTAREISIFMNVGATEAALQIKGANVPDADSDDMQVLEGADAIAADYDNRIKGAVTALQFTGAATVNDTVVTVTEVK